MCGIAGRVAAAPDERVNESALWAMCEVMAHRGPDDRNVRTFGRAGFGHLRLSIVDIAGGAQPLCGCDGDVWVTYNGEIYNHRLLRAELEARGHVFRTHSDTEVLVHGWESWGEKLPERLRGMFAFAIWDAKQQVCFLSRDRVGKKPLYYAMAGRDLVFASEAKALFLQPEIEPSLDEGGLAAYLALRYVPGPGTLFRNVERLQPGHSLTFRDGAISIRRYWDVPYSQEPDRRLCEAEQVARFAQLFEESVRLRLMGEVPVGVFLSGGIDSTAVAWAMRRHADGEVKSFSVGYEGDSEGELAYARLAAQHLGTRHREVLLTPELFGEFVPKLAWHLDEPIADAACVPLFYLARRAREEVVVVLSGEGADEVLAGYPIYRKQLLLERARSLGPLVTALAPWLAQQLDGVGAGTTRALEAVGLKGAGRIRDRLQKYLRWSAQPLERRYLGVSRAFSNDVLLGELLRSGAGPSAAERLASYFDATRGQGALSRMLYNDTKVWLPDDLLLKADKMSMASSIELRVPFLDQDLLALCWSLPDDLKLHGNVGKYLLRRAMAGKLPPEILRRPKKGFPVPTGAWLRGPLHAACREALLDPRGACRTFFSSAVLERLLEEHRRGETDRTEELYALWIFEAWHRRFLRGASRPQRPRAPERVTA
jgi:asparagine synthase (glutamine-hydrolysing)